MKPLKGNCNEYRGGLTIDGGEYSLGQSQWNYGNNNFIVYGGNEDQIFYMLFSDLPFGSFEAFDYAPNQDNTTGSIEVFLNGKIITRQFRKNEILLVFLSEEQEFCHDYIEISANEWKNFMRPYANSQNDNDYYSIRDYFIEKSIHCR